MGKTSVSNSLTQDNKVSAELGDVGVFMSPETVFTSPNSQAIKAGTFNGSLNMVTIGMSADGVQNLVNSVIQYGENNLDTVSDIAESMSDKLSVGVNSATDKMSSGITSAMEILSNKLTETQQGETGEFKTLLKQFGIYALIGMAIFGLLIRGKK